jgi:hypothetical protein
MSERILRILEEIARRGACTYEELADLAGRCRQIVSYGSEHFWPLVNSRATAGFHIAKALRVPENITLGQLPPYSPELNPIENLWHYLKSHFWSNRAYTD